MNGDQKEQKDTKTVLLFVPEALLKKQDVVSLLHIQKKDGRPDYTLSPVGRKEVQAHFPNLVEAARSQLLKFSPELMAVAMKEAETRHKKQKAGVPLSQFLAQSRLRHLHLQFAALRPFFPDLKWYHKTRRKGSTAYQTLACSFSAEKPQLRFDVVKQENRFSVAAQVVINGETESIAHFSRTGFFLEKENVYYQLSYSDYQTLDWLAETVGAGLEQPAFVEKILSRLESDYTVNRNHLLDEELIETLPTCQVLLSELNNSFLLLTPQWLYDGLVVEGPWKEKQELTIAGKRIIITRNAEKEQAFLQLLSSFHPNFSNQRNGYYYLSFADAQKKQWFMRTYYRLLELNVEVVGMDLLHHFRYSPHKIETEISGQREVGSRVHLQMVIRFGKESVSLLLVQKALYAGQKAVVLKDGSLGILNEDWMAAYATLIKHGQIYGSEIQVSRFLFIEEPADAKAETSWRPQVKESWKKMWKQWQSSAAPIFALPATIKAELRPYQQKGFEWMALLSQVGAGACLADDMGLGKTLQTICFLAWYTEQNPGTRHIIVCPTSLLYNWQGELTKFAPALKASVYHGSTHHGLDADAQVVITSYGTLRSHSDKLLAQSFGVAVIDESHYIKNPAAQITRVTQDLQATIRLALSGTPVVNNTFDLYTQLSFALPGLLGTKEFFKREYADAIDRAGDEAKIKALQRLTAPFVLRRTKEQVAADLPPKTEAVLWCSLHPAQEELYHEVREQVRSNLFMGIQNQGLQKSKLAVLQGLLKLRQICNDPKLLPAEEHGGRLQSAKRERLMGELLQLLERHRVLVFSQFSSMLQLLADECRQRGLDYFLLDGQTPAQKRMQMVDSFQQDRNAPRLFFISLKAGNTGLTLTAADYVFLFDPWWNTAVEQQAVDRTHRIGQTKNVFSYKLVCKNTVEERILELQRRKRSLAEELITAEEDFVKNLNEEEIEYLFA